jgi:hypothetical protein
MVLTEVEQTMVAANGCLELVVKGCIGCSEENVAQTGVHTDMACRPMLMSIPNVIPLYRVFGGLQHQPRQAREEAL